MGLNISFAVNAGICLFVCCCCYMLLLLLFLLLFFWVWERGQVEGIQSLN